MIKLTNKLYGASLIALAFSLNTANVNAQTCTTAPSCDTLGFTKSVTDCKDRTSLKCPFDQTKYFCLTAKEEEALGGTTGECEVGAILYSDKTCSTEVIPSKAAIGVVFESNRRLAVGLKQSDTKWSTDYFDVPGLDNLSESVAKTDFAGKSNTNIVITYCKGNNKSCPAFEYVTTYQTEGTSAGDWYLPALGELVEIYKNKDKIDKSLNLLKNNTSQTTSSISNLSSTYYWSSSEDGNYGAWDLYLSVGSVSHFGKSNYDNSVRPVLAF